VRVVVANAPARMRGMSLRITASVARRPGRAATVSSARRPREMHFSGDKNAAFRAPRARTARSNARDVRRASTDADGVERVSSAENATVKHFAKLCKSKAYRDERGSVVLSSSVLMRECFGRAGQGREAKTLFIAEWAEAPEGIRANRVIRAPASVLKKCAGVNNADGLDAVGEFASPKIMNAREFVDGAKQRDVVRVLAVEGVQDPGNLGTLTRTAVAFGWDTVALLPGTCDPFNDKAMRAARGATFRVDFVAFDSFDDLASAGRELNMELYAAEPSANEDVDPERAKAVAKACLVLGTEGQGLSDDALRACKPVAIPMSGEMESLNVGIAGGVLMYLMQATKA